MSSIHEIEARRAEMRAERAKARDEQIAKDLEAIFEIECETGEPLHTMTADGYKPGAPVKVAFRAPTALEYKRYCDMIGKARQKNDAIEQRKASETLAAACWVYPAKDTDERKAMLEAFPGVLLSLVLQVTNLAELRAEDEGKG